MILALTWYEWLWTIAAILVLIDTPAGIYFYHRHIKHMRFIEKNDL